VTSFSSRIDRRTALKVAGAGAAAISTGISLTADRALAQDATPTSAAAGELIIGKGAEAVGFDPGVVTAVSSLDLLVMAYENLVVFDDAGEPQPQLAESWEIIDDLTYVFTLRQGIKFSSGKALTADDVVYTFNRIKDPATASPRASQFGLVDAIEATDASTVTFRLSAPYGPFLATLAASYSAIVPQLDPPADFTTTIDGTGPFLLQEYKQDTETVLAANPAYWQPDVPKLATLRYKILPDEPSRLAAIRTGDIQLTTLADPVSADSARTSEGVTVVEQETTDYYLLGFNCKLAPFDNEKVRQALSMAIDRQAIIDAVFFGKGQVTGAIVPTLGDWAQDVAQLPRYQQDTDGAKALLEEAGVSDLSFKVVVGSLYPEFVSIALVIKDQLSEIGVTMDLEQVEWGTFVDRWIARDFEAFVSYNGSGNDPDLAVYAMLSTDGSTNAFQFSDEEVDRLLENGRTTTDAEERKAFYQEVEVAVAEAAPALFISTRYAYFATQSNVSGFAPSSSQTWDTLAQTVVS
jgi:peptide/nickel transport system substrate-binding protein